MPFLARALVPKQYRTARLRGYILASLMKSKRDITDDLYSTVATWKHPVNFTVRIGFKEDAVIQAWTDDYVWNLLNVGTLVRYARPSPDFTPKSEVRKLVSHMGSGSMLPSRKAYRGIDAREWTNVILEKYEKTFNQLIVAAIAKGLR